MTASTHVNSHKAETPVNHWVFISRSVQDAAEQHEREREQEFKNLLTRQQQSSSGQAPENQPPPPEIPPGEATEQAPAQ